MQRQRETPGSFFRIDLGDGTYTYGRVLGAGLSAFYDARSSVELAPAQIATSPVLFVTVVERHAITRGRWPVVGVLPLDAALERPVLFFKVDLVDAERFTVCEGGHFRPSTREECMGLEILAVWAPEHLEDRLRDHYAGRPCKWLAALYPPLPGVA